MKGIVAPIEENTDLLHLPLLQFVVLSLHIHCSLDLNIFDPTVLEFEM